MKLQFSSLAMEKPPIFEIDDLLAYDPEGEELSWSIPTSGFPQKGSAEIVGHGISPETLKYYPESIDVVDDQFVIRVSDGVKSDDLIVNVIMIWDSEGPRYFPSGRN